jgi:hypothetical protein
MKAEDANKILKILLRGWVNKHKSTYVAGSWDYDKEGVELIEATTAALEIQVDEGVGVDGETIQRILEWSPGHLPKSCKTKGGGYQEGDENAPFFSESYLYNLIGKEDARTLRSLMRPLWKAAGVSEGMRP